MTALRWSSLVEYMGRLPCWPWTNRTYVCVCLNLNMLFVSNAVWGRNLTLIRYFVVRIHYNCDDGPTLISNECMQRRCVELTLYKQWVRLYVYALEFEGFIGVWFSIEWNRNFTLNIYVLFEYYIQYLVLQWWLRLFLRCLLNYMERCHVGPGWTERAFELLCVRVREYLNWFEGVTGVRNVMRS